MHFQRRISSLLIIAVCCALSAKTLSAQVTDSASLAAFFTPSELAIIYGDSSKSKPTGTQQMLTASNSQAPTLQNASTQQGNSAQQTLISKPEPVSFGAQYISDLSNNFSGGLAKGYTQMGLIDLTALISSDSAGLYKGGELMVHAEHSHGGGITKDYLGDFQTLSNIESTSATYLYQLWYRQSFGNSSLLFGRHDLNSEFMITDYGLLFVNSSFGVISSGSLNVPLSIYPRTSLALVYTADISDNAAFKFGVYDGDPEGFDTDPYGLSMKISATEGALVIGEGHYQFTANDEVTSIWKLGAYYHTAEFENYKTGAMTAGNWGVYLHADKKIFSEKNNPENGLGVFGQLAVAPSATNFTDLYLGIGLHYTGLLPKGNDKLGLAYAHMHASKYWTATSPSDIWNYESAIELTWKVPFGEHFFLQPDVQYLINPGLEKQTANALAGTLRCLVVF
ncbi:MAG: carbohydrate porin [Bacteroidia bacterium]